MKGIKLIFPVIALFGVFFFYSTAKAEVIQITSNSNSKAGPSLYDGKIAWSERDGGQDTYNIYYWDGSSIIPITNNTIRDMWPSLYDGKIAWVHWDPAFPNTREIHYWDGNKITKVAVVTNSSGIILSHYDGKIAYSAWDGNDYEIYLWNGTDIQQITDNTTWDNPIVA